MKNTSCSFALLLLIGLSCQPAADQLSDSLPHRVAKAYGYENMKDVEEMTYTWNVRRDSVTVLSRNWTWNPQKGNVSYTGPDTTGHYTLAEKTEAHASLDQKFINDKYWLIFPFQLAWDTGYSYEEVKDQRSPIQGLPTTKLIIRYNESDGYTPGDAYDLYIDDNYRIKEWVFRRGDGPEGRAMTWENEKDFDGITIAMDHKNDAGEKALWFTDVEVKRK
jgi:hypothetical protein